jgi:2-polyprenyl-3-methyl-5-hydroxy-6-metoxy-1,4-benzoquinol methylase
MRTDDAEYSARLEALQRAPRWKKVLRVQEPYRRRLLALQPGRVLDVGCGIGRSLTWLEGSRPVGVDHNATAVAVCRNQGLEAYTSEEFDPAEWAGTFDSLLLAHVVEHMTAAEAEALLKHYLPSLRPGGKVIVICPQERGQASDPTHVTFFDAADLSRLLQQVGLTVQRTFSFPFPRRLGKLFIYNETYAVGRS